MKNVMKRIVLVIFLVSGLSVLQAAEKHDRDWLDDEITEHLEGLRESSLEFNKQNNDILAAVENKVEDVMLDFGFDIDELTNKIIQNEQVVQEQVSDKQVVQKQVPAVTPITSKKYKCGQCGGKCSYALEYFSSFNKKNTEIKVDKKSLVGSHTKAALREDVSSLQQQKLQVNQEEVVEADKKEDDDLSKISI